MTSSSRWNLVLLGAVGAAAILTNHVVLESFATTGGRWAVQQVPYYINPVNLDVPESEAEGAIRAGADAWSLQSDANIRLSYAGRTTGSSLVNNGKNEVFFRNESNGGYGAYTYWWYDSSGRLLDADTVFYDGAYRFATNGTGCSGALYIEAFATHEFGHALGLGHSSVGEATMYPNTGYCTQAWYSLAPDDVAGIEALYPPAGSVMPPSPPTNLSVVRSATNSSSALDLSWIDGSLNEDQFLVERSLDGISFAQVAAVGANASRYTNGGLAASTTYTYRVRASNAGGFSAYTNSASQSTAAPSVPASPTGASPAPFSTSVGVDADLAWQCAGATSYDVYYGTSSDPPLQAAGVTSPSRMLPTMAASTTYYWRIVATNAAGTTSGPVWQFTTRSVKIRGKK